MTTYPIYLMTAYAIFWLLTFVLVFSIWARQRKLETQLRALEEQSDQDLPVHH